ncbi:glycosyltransferase MshA [Gordonia hirsuta DSM 44140 = NBRC 16056]|uniref:D-inositol-3-phosphate glycosyltransferase n=1 Tax=Gordonia hirsuta DSM 44140 = NBRC 16056 TaxID=1121927 RepID=L7L9Z6_9ACTN|nr:D-inositol-3-phosphate glycosyltransferase [Gordonia hirsuta]GAC56877.1 glycosyltransferase MshA [Gordonia hirsuta DSM 44140 = NBRC 16056]
MTGLRRLALISVHTSPLSQPGTGDAGGMNVYVWQTARRLAQRGIEVEIFTRATSSSDSPIVPAAPGVLVRHVEAGPFDGLDKRDLPGQLCAFSANVLRAEAAQAPGYYDLIHSHYWLSGQVGWLARDRWRVPLVHTAHTLAAVKNASLAGGDTAEPMGRVIGEQQVVAEADRLIANTRTEADELVDFYDADPDKIDIVAPGVDLDCYTPGPRAAARAALGLVDQAVYVTFVGRIQPLKAPDVLLAAMAPLIRADPTGRLRLLIVGGPSGSGLARPTALVDLAARLGVGDRVDFRPPQPPADLVQVYRASNLVAVPSFSESFGLVAIEAQACGVPVIAADVGGLGVAVVDGVSGRLVAGHDVDLWTGELADLLADPVRLDRYGAAAVAHAREFSWEHTTDALLASYDAAMGDFPPGPTRRAPLGRRARNWLRTRPRMAG